MDADIICHGLNFSVTNCHCFKGRERGMTDAGMQEADSDRAGICEGAIENALVTARGVPTGEGTKQIEKMSNQHLGFGSLPACFCLPPISVKPR